MDTGKHKWKSPRSKAKRLPKCAVNITLTGQLPSLMAASDFFDEVLELAKKWEVIQMNGGYAEVDNGQKD